MQLARSVRSLAIGLLVPVFWIPTLTADDRNKARVCLDTRGADDVDGIAVSALRAEASRLWADNRVELRWQSSHADCDDHVPVVFDEWQLNRVKRVSGDTLAVSVFSGRNRVIYVSPLRALRMLVRAQGIVDAQSAAGRNVLGGTLMGRVIAHELGHVLLGTLSHSSEGLMRPIFNTRDVLSPDERFTRLSMEDTARLVTRFSLQAEPDLLALMR